jgi:hypothetical protein
VTSLGGVTVESFAAADFNQDGIPDLAITGRLQNGPRSMFVALGNGDGTFTLAGTYNASLAPPLAASVVAVGDVNGDHIPDIIVANSDGFDSQTGQYTPSNVAVLLGIGNGQFSPPITTVAGNGPRSIVIADLNGDGKADVAISNVGWNDISLLLGNGDGSFQQPVNFGMDGAGPLAVADFNGDGSPDLAVGFGNTVSILYSSSSGPAASLSSTSVGFGNEGIGYISSASTLTLSNTGSTTLNISAMSLFGPQSSEFQQVSNCGPTLASGAHCTFQVSFNPQASGLRTATIRITDNAFNSPQNIFLSGTGVTPLSAVSISPGSLTFGNQYVGSSSAPRTVTLSSTGNIPLTFSGIALSGANASDFSSTNNCPTSLSNGTSCTISVVFSPGAARSSTASLAITDGAANSPQTVSITGTAVAPSLGLGLAPGGVSTATVSAGSRATYSLAIGGMGMSGAASLTCSGTPTGAVCSVPPTETLSAGTPLTFSVSVTTTAPTIGLSHPWRLTPPRLFFAMGLLMVFVLPGSFGKRRQSSCLLVLMLVALLCCCGGGSVPQANLNRTPSGTYPLVVSASMGGQTENVTLKLIVQ